MRGSLTGKFTAKFTAKKNDDVMTVTLTFKYGKYKLSGRLEVYAPWEEMKGKHFRKVHSVFTMDTPTAFWGHGDIMDWGNACSMFALRVN